MKIQSLRHYFAEDHPTFVILSPTLSCVFVAKSLASWRSCSWI